MNPMTDEIARKAAALVVNNDVASIRDAIRAAMADATDPAATPPGQGRVRQHIQAMTMQALGEDGYRDLMREQWGGLEEVMASIEHLDDDARCILVGRAAKGYADGDGRVHVRVYSRMTDTDLAGGLVDLGYAEPAFETADTRVGRLNRVILLDEAVGPIVLTLCRPDLWATRTQDLFSGAAIDTLDVDGLRKRIASE